MSKQLYMKETLRDMVLDKQKEIERLNNILDEIDLIFYRIRYVGFNSIKDENKFLYENINEVRKICQYKKITDELDGILQILDKENK